MKTDLLLVLVPITHNIDPMATVPGGSSLVCVVLVGHQEPHCGIYYFSCLHQLNHFLLLVGPVLNLDKLSYTFACLVSSWALSEQLLKGHFAEHPPPQPRPQTDR